MYYQPPQYFHPGMTAGTYCAPQPQPVYPPGFHYPPHPTMIPMPMATPPPMGCHMSQPQYY